MIFKLTRPARSKGGDRYEAYIKDEKPWVIYIPQRISRTKGTVVDGFEITFKPVLYKNKS